MPELLEATPEPKEDPALLFNCRDLLQGMRACRLSVSFVNGAISKESLGGAKLRRLRRVDAVGIGSAAIIPLFSIHRTRLFLELSSLDLGRLSHQIVEKRSQFAAESASLADMSEN
jgi:hypothetical protein